MSEEQHDPWAALDDSIDAMFEAFRLDNIPDSEQPMAQRFYDLYQCLKSELAPIPKTYSAISALAQAHGYAVEAGIETRRMRDK